MKSFKTEIKKRILWITLFAILGGLIIITALIINLNSQIKADSILPAEALAGLFAGLEFTSIYRILKYRKALSDYESLETLHINETDERNHMISFTTCKSCLYLAFAILGLAGIIASFFNWTVFMTIGITLIILLILYGALMLYYSRKF